MRIAGMRDKRKQRERGDRLGVVSEGEIVMMVDLENRRSGNCH